MARISFSAQLNTGWTSTSASAMQLELPAPAAGRDQAHAAAEHDQAHPVPLGQLVAGDRQRGPDRLLQPLGREACRRRRRRRRCARDGAAITISASRRALARQLRSRGRSPAWYGRRPANSVPGPMTRAGCVPDATWRRCGVAPACARARRPGRARTRRPRRSTAVGGHQAQRIGAAHHADAEVGDGPSASARARGPARPAMPSRRVGGGGWSTVDRHGARRARPAPARPPGAGRPTHVDRHRHLPALRRPRSSGRIHAGPRPGAASGPKRHPQRRPRSANGAPSAISAPRPDATPAAIRADGHHQVGRPAAARRPGAGHESRRSAESPTGTGTDATHSRHHLVDPGALDPQLGAQREAVEQRRHGHGLDVLGGDEVAAGQRGARPRRQQHRPANRGGWPPARPRSGGAWPSTMSTM